MRRPYDPDEDAVLLAYVARCCDWRAVMPRLRGRTHTAARQRLTKLRAKAGTLWSIDQRDRARQQAAREVDRRREQARKQPRGGGRFA